jgi:hypothetical protein
VFERKVKTDNKVIVINAHYPPSNEVNTNTLIQTEIARLLAIPAYKTAQIVLMGDFNHTITIDNIFISYLVKYTCNLSTAIPITVSNNEITISPIAVSLAYSHLTYSKYTTFDVTIANNAIINKPFAPLLFIIFISYLNPRLIVLIHNTIPSTSTNPIA